MDNSIFPFSRVEDQTLFRDLVRQYFQGRGYKNVVFNEAGFVTLDESPEECFPVWNLAHVCMQASSEHWNEIIRAHFDIGFEATLK